MLARWLSVCRAVIRSPELASDPGPALPTGGDPSADGDRHRRLGGRLRGAAQHPRRLRTPALLSANGREHRLPDQVGGAAGATTEGAAFVGRPTRLW